MRRVGLHHDSVEAAHDVPGHPERPERVAAILEHLAAVDLARDLPSLPERVATEDDLLLVHDPALVDLVRQADVSGGAWLDADTAVVPGSYGAALRSVGGALAAVDAVVDGVVDAAFCIDRPPGHHATLDRAMGFCFFNQVAIAARYLMVRHGVQRVAIVDFDVHHGNGTQDAFYADPNVLYCSLHEYPFYPGTGHWRDTGADEARGTTINLPLPAGCGDVEYLAGFDRVVVPAVHRFRPEFILVSAGFDAHLADPLADMAVTRAGYEGMTRRLAEAAEDLCGGRLVYVLEGGYRLESLARAVEVCLRALRGEASRESTLDSGPLRSEVARLFDSVSALHALR